MIESLRPQESVGMLFNIALTASNVSIEKQRIQ